MFVCRCCESRRVDLNETERGLGFEKNRRGSRESTSEIFVESIEMTDIRPIQSNEVSFFSRVSSADPVIFGKYSAF
jgi:hypothetical protein